MYEHTFQGGINDVTLKLDYATYVTLELTGVILVDFNLFEILVYVTLALMTFEETVW